MEPPVAAPRRAYFWLSLIPTEYTAPADTVLDTAPQSGQLDMTAIQTAAEVEQGGAVITMPIAAPEIETRPSDTRIEVMRSD